MGRRKQNKVHMCLECHKIFRRSYNLKLHKRVHTDYRPYVCTEPGCEERFRWRSSLLSHGRCHVAEGCDAFLDSSSLSEIMSQLADATQSFGSEDSSSNVSSGNLPCVQPGEEFGERTTSFAQVSAESWLPAPRKAPFVHAKAEHSPLAPLDFKLLSLAMNATTNAGTQPCPTSPLSHASEEAENWNFDWLNDDQLLEQLCRGMGGFPGAAY